jgi:hypothetical protein
MAICWNRQTATGQKYVTCKDYQRKDKKSRHAKAKKAAGHAKTKKATGHAMKTRRSLRRSLRRSTRKRKTTSRYGY